MRWIKEQPLESILAKIDALQIIKYGDDTSENIIDYFYDAIPFLYPDEIIEYFKNVIGWRIQTWEMITEEENLHIWYMKMNNFLWIISSMNFLKRNKNKMDVKIYLL